MGNFLNKIMKISLLSKLILRKVDGKSAFNILGKKREMEGGEWREIGAVRKAMSRFSLKDFHPLMIAPVKFSVVEKIHNFSSSSPSFSPRKEKRDWVGALRKPLFYFALRNPSIRNLVPQMKEIPISSIKPKRELSISVPSLFNSQYVEEDVFSSLLKSLRKQLGF